MENITIYVKKLVSMIFIIFQVFLQARTEDKIKFTIYVIILFLSLCLRNRCKSLEILHRKFKEKFMGQLSLDGLTISTNQIYYSLVDYQSLSIIIPENESWAFSHLKIKKGNVFIDVGAHIGKYSLYIASIVGNEGLVIALEPNKINYRNLLKGIELNGFRNIIALNIAAWCKNKNLRIYIGETSGHHTVKDDTGLGYFIVEAKKLDSIVNYLNIKRIDWIKIDVEGAEFEVLRGSVEVLNKFKPKIIIEVFPRYFRKVSSFFEKNNYKITKISPHLMKDISYYIAEPLMETPI